MVFATTPLLRQGRANLSVVWLVPRVTTGSAVVDIGGVRRTLLALGRPTVPVRRARNCIDAMKRSDTQLARKPCRAKPQVTAPGSVAADDKAVVTDKRSKPGIAHS
jgi:hypothetical protein